MGCYIFVSLLKNILTLRLTVLPFID